MCECVCVCVEGGGGGGGISNCHTMATFVSAYNYNIIAHTDTDLYAITRRSRESGHVQRLE